MNLFSFIKRLFQPSGDNPSGDRKDERAPEELIQLIKGLQITEELEYSCDEVFRLLDQYAETIVEGGEAEKLMPLVEHHLEMCGCCREELEALVQILEANPA